MPLKSRKLIFFKKSYRVVAGRYLIFGGVRLPLRRVGRGYRVVYRRRKYLLFGKRPKYQARVQGKWRYVKRSGSKRRYVQVGRRRIYVKRRRSYSIVYRGRKRLVKKARNRFTVRYIRRWIKAGRARYGKRLPRGKEDSRIRC